MITDTVELAAWTRLLRHSIPRETPLPIQLNDMLYLWPSLDILERLRVRIYEESYPSIFGMVETFKNFIKDNDIQVVPAIREGTYLVRELGGSTRAFYWYSPTWYAQLFEHGYEHPEYGPLRAWTTSLKTNKY